MIDSSPLHNMPHFEHDPNAIYSRIVYAAKSTDVAHVICNGRWLMRDRALLTLDEQALLVEARDYAVKVDQFLKAREENMLSKLLAIGGISQSESFEVQVKAELKDEQRARQAAPAPGRRDRAQGALSPVRYLFPVRRMRRKGACVTVKTT